MDNECLIYICCFELYTYEYTLSCEIVLLILYSMFPRSTNETFAEKLYQTFKDNKRFSKPKLSRTDFTINHYAGDVSEVQFGLHSYSSINNEGKRFNI